MMSGEDVRQVQRITGANVDGIFGPLTELAVKDFQAKTGLAMDGVVGQKTWQAIQEFTGEEPVQVKKMEGGSLLWGAAGLVLLAGLGAAIYNHNQN